MLSIRALFKIAVLANVALAIDGRVSSAGAADGIWDCFQIEDSFRKTQQPSESDLDCLNQIETWDGVDRVPFEPYRDGASLVARHAGSATTGYRLPERKRPRSHFDEDEYLQSLEEFSDVSQCVDQKPDGSLDLSAIRFDDFDHHEDAFVCFQWIALSLKSVYDVYEWMHNLETESDVIVHLWPHQMELYLGISYAKRPYEVPGFWRLLFNGRYSFGLTFRPGTGLIDLNISSDNLN